LWGGGELVCMFDDFELNDKLTCLVTALNM
jgi:hypothetical protein